VRSSRKNITMNNNKPPLVYAISVLMLAGAAGRGLLEAFEFNSSVRWLIVGLLAFYGLLLFSEFAIYRRFPSYLKVYFVIQASVVGTLLLLPLDPPSAPISYDYFALLFIPLCAQAILYFPRPESYYWVIAFSAVSVIALHIQYGLSEGFKYSITYIFGYIMMSLLAKFYIDAEEAKDKLNKANQKLQEYASKVETLAVAEERNRLARDLHDSVTQSLYSLTLFAEAASEELSAGEVGTVSAHLKELRQTSQQALQEMRLMVFELRPPELETKGLALALQERLEAVESRSGMETAINIGFKGRLPSNMELGLYSIAREAMNNILKHSQATKTTINLTNEHGKVTLEIWDNGNGLDQTPGNFNAGLGIKGMKERADQMGAELILEKIPEGGTRLRVEVPYDGTD